MKVTKNIFLFLIFLFFSKNLLADCSSVYSSLGKPSKVSLLWLDDKNGKQAQYALINKIGGDQFTLCKRARFDYSIDDSNKEFLKDLDVYVDFSSAKSAFNEVFKITSEETTRYILSKLYLPDYSISKADLITQYSLSLKEQQVSKYITKKPSKKIKKEKKTQSSYINKKPKKQETNISSKIKSFDDLPDGHAYFYAIDNQKNSLIGYVAEDQKSKLIKIGNRKFRKGNSGKMFNLNDGLVCDVYSTVETARSNRVYDGKATVTCDDGRLYSGNWVQKGGEGRGIAIDQDGNELDFAFANTKYLAESGLSDKLKTYVAKKPIQKKPKIVKKPEPKKQKKINVEVKELDTTDPVLKIKETFVFKTQKFTIKGKVSDERADEVYIFVDDEPIPVERNGTFEFTRYTPKKNITYKVVAMDSNGNDLEKIIRVEIKGAKIVKKIPKLDPTKIRNVNRSDVVALVIGIENYSDAPPAIYANKDAEFFADYARYAFGASRDNVKLLIDKEASLAQIFRSLEQWLPSKIQENQTDVVLFFAGHGLASNDGKDLYLLAHDSARDLLSRTALSRVELFQLINKHNPKSVKVFFDACYSGQTRDDKTLIASARPISIGVRETGGVPDNFTIFTASQGNQISSPFKEAKHGIFSFYLMKGLEGEADKDKNREITNGELLAYMEKKVNAKAVELGRKQVPSLIGQKDDTLNRY